mmetsp:Transcript_20847/g.62205  ORF Transcript_20847/g.62205 Transcript_20847/m.62205 type:complete len:250 (+) Transcript_20847:115-864(+)
MELESARSAEGEAYSRLEPLSSTSTLSQAAMVPRRCAMVMRVADESAPELSTRWMLRSVAWSTLAVASSIKTSRDRRAMARAKQINWRSPTDKFVPNSLSSKSSDRAATRAPAGRSAESSVLSDDADGSDASDCCDCDALRPAPRANSKACASSSSVRSPNMSRLKRMVPANSVGACGTMAMRPRSALSPTDATSTPSMRTAPPWMGYMRRIDCTSVDLPAPVLPTTPTEEPASTVSDRCRSAGSGCRG